MLKKERVLTFRGTTKRKSNNKNYGMRSRNRPGTRFQNRTGTCGDCPEGAGNLPQPTRNWPPNLLEPAPEPAGTPTGAEPTPKLPEPAPESVWKLPESLPFLAPNLISAEDPRAYAVGEL